MFKTIMVPVDLVHADTQQKALDVAADLAKRHNATIHVVSVGGEMPGKLGHNPAEFARTVQAFADGLQSRHGIRAEAHAVAAHDPAVETTSQLMKAIDDIGADLVIMASHAPGVLDHIFSSHGGYIAQHARTSVFIVR